MRRVHVAPVAFLALVGGAALLGAFVLGLTPPLGDAAAIKAGPSLQHPFGADDTGRDVLGLLVRGAATACRTALLGALLALVIGVPLGAIAGFYGGLADFAVLRAIELFLCFPKLFFVLAVGAFVGPSTATVILMLGLLGWTSFARLVRGEMIAVREREFVLCARGLGIASLRVLVRHALPQARGSVLVMAAFACADAIVVESTLTFLGLGPGVQVPSWGSVLRQGWLYALDGVWHLWLFPSLVLVATVWALHALADRWSSPVAHA